MPKLKKFKTQNDKKVSTKNLFIAFGIILMIMGGVIISKSYAIYKMQKEFDVIKTQIGSFTNGDVRVAAMVDGEETSQFPSYETNYKVEKVKCSNEVQGEWDGQWDTKNWRLIIDDMRATSTKCTIYFNSKETNEETPIAYSKEELLAINEEIKNMAYEQMKTQLLNDTYPIGSIYMSTTDDTVEKVQSKFGGTWVKYSEGRTLVGVGNNGTSTYTVNQTGGSEIHKHLSPLAAFNVAGSGFHVGHIAQEYFGAAYKNYKVYGSKQDYNADSSPEKIDIFQILYTDNASSLSPYTAVYMYKRTA